MTRNVSGKIASGSRKSINIHSHIEIFPPYLQLRKPEFSLKETRIYYSRSLFSRPPPPLTCLPLARIFSNKSHADEKSTMAVAHKETRVFTMSSRCIETMSLKIHRDFFSFFLSFFSFFFLFSRFLIRFDFVFFLFRRILFERVLSRVHSILFETLNRSSSCLLVFFARAP